MNQEGFAQQEVQKFDGTGGVDVHAEFVECVKSIENEVQGSETLGSSIEFYDEDGCIILVIVIEEEAETAEFNFVMENKMFTMPLAEMPDAFKSEAV